MLLQVQGHLIGMIVHVMLDTYVLSRLLFLAICVHQLNSLTEIVKHARGMKKPNTTRYIYFFLLFFCS